MAQLKERDLLKEKLTKLQYDVTQNCSTEPPFENEFWNNKEDGIYVDIISGKPLFCSVHKYDSGTGWPSTSSGSKPKRSGRTTVRICSTAPMVCWSPAASATAAVAA